MGKDVVNVVKKPFKSVGAALKGDIRGALDADVFGIGKAAGNLLFGKEKGEGKYNFGTAGMPGMPTYQGMTDKQGNLMNRFSAQNVGLGEFQNKLRNDALSEGLSPQEMAMQQSMLDKFGQSNVAQRTGAIEDLARTGGVSGGARERLMSRFGTQQALGEAGIRSNIGMQSLGRKQNLMGQFANLEHGKAMSDLNALRAENQAKREFDLNRYDTQGKIWGGMMSARAAQANAPKSKGLIGGLFG